MTVGERIKEARLKAGLSADELADKIGKDRSTIYRYESKDIEKLPTSVLKPLCEALQVSPAFLMGWDNTSIFDIENIIPMPQMKKIPLLGDIACGEPILAQENIDRNIDIPANINADFALRCKGDSMINARILNGDVVYIKQQPDVENGEIAAVLIEDEATLKRVYKYPDKIILQAENTAFPPIVYMLNEASNIRILGKAVGFTSEVR